MSCPRSGRTRVPHHSRASSVQVPVLADMESDIRALLHGLGRDQVDVMLVEVPHVLPVPEDEPGSYDLVEALRWRQACEMVAKGYAKQLGLWAGSMKHVEQTLAAGQSSVLVCNCAPLNPLMPQRKLVGTLLRKVRAAVVPTGRLLRPVTGGRLA